MSFQAAGNNECNGDHIGSHHEQLTAVKVRFTPESSPDSVKTLPVSPASTPKVRKAERHKKHQPSHGDSFLLTQLGPNHPEIAKTAAIKTIQDYSQSEEESADSDEDESDDVDLDTKIAGAMERRAETERSQTQAMLERETKRKAESAAQMAAAALGMSPPAINSALRGGSEAMDGVETSPIGKERPNAVQTPSFGLGLWNGFKVPDHHRVPPLAGSANALRPLLDVKPLSPPAERGEESLVGSPLSVHLKKSDSPSQRLPPLTPSSPSGPSSPQSHLSQKLPSFRQIDEMAIKASHENLRRFSTGGPSPVSPFASGSVRSPFPTSHSSRSPYGVLSPQSALSPPSGISSQFAFSRRHSQTSDFSPALLSASNTESSYASTDSYNSSTQPTSHSDMHHPNSEGVDRILPLPVPSIQPLTIQTIPPHGSGVFLCDYTGCTAPPFQTQYLLNSHANVHSQNRPHYCPVRGCPRAEGGKGFKRKNEMIRHGLVHDSPGYVCPFCPDREHKYPRPDNLQRHVRVHHMDKNKDDAQLRDVLAQRPEGGGNRGRRRRLGS